MSGIWPRLVPEGDRGLLVEYPPEVSPEINALVRGADAVVGRLHGVIETVPTFRSVLVAYDPRTIGFTRLVEQVEASGRRVRPSPADAGRLIEVPVVYGGEAGPDLEAVAAATGLDPDEVVRAHCEQIYLVYMLGFSPGFPYMGLLPRALRLPRRASPRMRVPAGSVGIADTFCGIYPQETAGGWHLLGRTPVSIFDPGRTPAFALQPGDRVRFVPLRDGRAGDTRSASVHRVQTTPQVIAGQQAAPPRPVFEVVQPGLVTTVQDLGRTGWRRFGIPSSGALDRRSLRAANLAVGNPAGAAALELTFPGPTLRVLDDTEIGIAGADFDARLNGAAIDPEERVSVHRDDIITFQTPRQGQWLYLSVAGGIDVPEVFGSRSTYARGGLGGGTGRPHRAGDLLGRGEATNGPRAVGHALQVARPSGPIRVVLGPQAEAFTVEAQAALLSQPFEVTVRRDRSGIRLSGSGLIHRGSAEVLSDGILPGAIQVPADRAALIVLADGPTTGGYAKIACVIDADLDRLAQATPGTALRFEAVTVDAAHAAALD